MTLNRSKIYSLLSAEERVELGREEIKEIKRVRENQIFKGMTKGLAGLGYRLDDVAFERALNNAKQRVAARNEKLAAENDVAEDNINRVLFPEDTVSIEDDDEDDEYHEHEIEIPVIVYLIVFVAIVIAILDLHVRVIQNNTLMLPAP